MHRQLWPALAGAVVGLPIVAAAALRGARRWQARSRVSRAAALLFVVLSASAYALHVYAWFVEPNRLVVRRVEIASDRWRGAPLNVAVLSDTHVGSPHVTAARVRGLVARVNELGPDLVVLLGDYAGSHEPETQRSGAERSEVLDGVAAFGGLRAPLGVVTVLGNHDEWYGGASIRRVMKAASVTLLSNEHVELAWRGRAFAIAGLADADTGTPDFGRALAGTEALDTIVLSHSPDPFVGMPVGPAVMLAGHTHCGQVSVPFFGRPILPTRTGQRYACGRVDEGGRTLYVTGGFGTSILPVRFGNPPELVLLTLLARADRR